MFKKHLTLILLVLVLDLALGATAFGATTNEKRGRVNAEKVKANIIKLGTGKDARIEVKLTDGTKVKGYVSQINENSFVVIDEKSSVATDVPYQNAKRVKGRNLATGVAIAIYVGVIVGILLIIAAITYT